MVEDNTILDKLRKYFEQAKVNSMGIDDIDISSFSCEDLVGKTIQEFRRIKNPLPYNPQVESPNPGFFKVFVYSDGSYLLHMDIGWHDGSTTHSFLVEDENIRYSTSLYIDDII